jgi:Ca2+-binding RTX toxin-like protein
MARLFDGTAGNDTIFAEGGPVSPGVTVIFTGPGPDDALFGAAGNDLMGGGAGNDGLYGEAGNDTLLGGAGADYLDGGANYDLASYAGGAGVYAALFAPQLNTGDAAGDVYVGIEGLIGSSFNDTLVGDAGNNRLEGGDGDDLLEGQAGDDDLFGGLGSDTVSYFDAAGVNVDLEAGIAADGYQPVGFDFLFQIENVNGSNSADAISGDTLGNILRGVGGNDALDGRAGNDTLVGGAGADSLVGGAGDDILTDHEQQPALAGASPPRASFVASDSDTLQGGEGADWIYASGGGDVIDGGTGIDSLMMSFSGGTAAIVLTSAAGGAWTVTNGGVVTATATNIEAVSFTGGALNDSLSANLSAFAVVMDGDAGNDVLRGSRNGDVLVGSGGNDRLFGFGGDDFLVGGAGRDVLNGGLGADLFRYDLAAEGRDTIQGFASGEDRLWIDASGFRGGLAEGMDLDATGRFVLGSTATAARGQFLYEGTTGVLLWDVDGTGARGALTIATLDPGTTLLASDFLLVA